MLSFILKRKKMKKRERKISYLKRMKKYLCTWKKNEKRCYMLCAHQINGRTMAADHSIAVKSRHQSLHVFIISKLQFTIYIIKKKKINATTTSTTTSMSHKSINARSMIQSKKIKNEREAN